MKSKKGSQMHHSEIEKWKAVYRILFPDDNDADMPSPCKLHRSSSLERTDADRRRHRIQT
jgi:hypothetical protein